GKLVSITKKSYRNAAPWARALRRNYPKEIWACAEVTRRGPRQGAARSGSDLHSLDAVIVQWQPEAQVRRTVGPGNVVTVAGRRASRSNAQRTLRIGECK